MGDFYGDTNNPLLKLQRERRMDDARNFFRNLGNQSEAPEFLSNPKLTTGAIVKLNFENLSQNQKLRFSDNNIGENSIGIILRPPFQGKYEVLWEKWPDLPSLVEKEAQYVSYRGINHAYDMQPDEITPTGQFITDDELENATRMDGPRESPAARRYYVSLLEKLKTRRSNFDETMSVFSGRSGGKRARKSRKSRKVRKAHKKYRKSRKARKSRRRARR